MKRKFSVRQDYIHIRVASIKNQKTMSLGEHAEKLESLSTASRTIKCKTTLENNREAPQKIKTRII